MISISILALQEAVLTSVANSQHVFSMVNEFLRQSGHPPLFTIQLVGVTKEVTLLDGLYTMHSNTLLKDVKQTDLIIIPALSGNIIHATHLNKEYGVWLCDQYRNGAEVASLCAGAFLLAFSGLLNGKQCTTHWLYAEEFRSLYPSVHLVEEKMLTDQNGLYSSAGNNASWNLLLHLVEKYTDRAMAIRVAKYFLIDLGRSAQSPFVIFKGMKDHEDEIIKDVQYYMEQHFNEKLTVGRLAELFHLSTRTFERRFKKATRITVIDYLQRVRIEATKKQLETGRKTIHEIMHTVGYADLQTFRDIFKKITGISPVAYREKYNREPSV